MRFVSYNIHRAVGVDGVRSIEAIRAVLAGVEPDAVGLNEVLRAPVAVDQPGRLAKALGMRYRFDRTTLSRGLPFGNAAFVRGRILRRRSVQLSSGRSGFEAGGRSTPVARREGPTRNEAPTRAEQPMRAEEPRRLLLLEVDVDGLAFTFGVTHLDPKKEFRLPQLERLVAALPRGTRLVLAGDFNAQPYELDAVLAPTGLRLIPGPPTFPAPQPRVAIDHLLFSDHWELRGAFAATSTASDHAALVADLVPKTSSVY